MTDEEKPKPRPARSHLLQAQFLEGKQRREERRRKRALRPRMTAEELAKSAAEATAREKRQAQERRRKAAEETKRSSGEDGGA